MPTSLIVDAVLFDMDGTLIDSTPGVVKAWHKFAKDYNLTDVPALIEASHGVRSIDSLRKLCGIEDQDKLVAEVTRFESEVIAGGLLCLPGVTKLIDQISAGATLECPGWTIVTSATKFYTPAALAAAGIPMPPTTVTSEDVTKGKPNPDPYLEGARRCGVHPTKCMVIEDAASGLKAGKAAGAKTLAVLTSTTREGLLASGAEPDYVVRDLSFVSARWVGGKVEVTIRDEEAHEAAAIAA